jgi:myo-inositol 2-dehydrogenase/D-chiro-inositol 1-dehydrogenase
MSPVRIGLIGYGLFGKHHAAAIERTAEACLAAIAAPSPASRAAASADHPRAAVFDDYRRMLREVPLDIVHVVGPNHLHYEMARAALEAGCHVLLEKPMALRIDQCDALLELAQRGGLLLGVNHELRLSSLWGEVRRLLDAGTLGTPQYALLELSRFPYRQGSQGWRYDRARVGSWILEEPIHFFDLARWYLATAGEPVSIYALASARDPGRPELHDNFTALVQFPGGAYAVVSQTLAAFEHHVTCKITGTRGALWAQWSAPDARSDVPVYRLRVSDGSQVRDVPLDRPAGELVELHAHIGRFVQAVRQGSALPVSGVDGRWSVALCLAAEASLQAGQPIELATFRDVAGR